MCAVLMQERWTFSSGQQEAGEDAPGDNIFIWEHPSKIFESIHPKYIWYIASIKSANFTLLFLNMCHIPKCRQSLQIFLMMDTFDTKNHLQDLRIFSAKNPCWAEKQFAEDKNAWHV